jgi:putative FmdB family regulatory protein
MPIYEYRCLDCSHEFELIQKFSDPAVKTCTVCAGAVQKLISRSAFHLKGSGWYVTDYGRNGSTSSNQTEKSTTESGEAKSGDTKAAATSEAKSGDTKTATTSASSTSSSSTSSSPSSKTAA